MDDSWSSSAHCSTHSGSKAGTMRRFGAETTVCMQMERAQSDRRCPEQCQCGGKHAQAESLWSGSASQMRGPARVSRHGSTTLGSRLQLPRTGGNDNNSAHACPMASPGGSTVVLSPCGRCLTSGAGACAGRKLLEAAGACCVELDEVVGTAGVDHGEPGPPQARPRVSPGPGASSSSSSPNSDIASGALLRTRSQGSVECTSA